MTVQKFRKKPVEIEAVQWIGAPTSGVLASATSVIDWVLANGGTARYHEERTHDTSEVVETGEVKSFERPESVPAHIAIDTLEGTMRALPGDYIIRGVQGEFYPCKPDIFAATYDEVAAE